MAGEKIGRHIVHPRDYFWSSANYFLSSQKFILNWDSNLWHCNFKSRFLMVRPLGPQLFSFCTKAVVLNLIGGAEPCKQPQCIPRTLRNRKKYFFKTYVYILLTHKFNYTSVAHKISEFKEINQQNTNFTAISMRLLSLLFRYKFGNAWLRIG